jgi:hypothetical protein
MRSWPSDQANPLATWSLHIHIQSKDTVTSAFAQARKTIHYPLPVRLLEIDLQLVAFDLRDRAVADFWWNTRQAAFNGNAVVSRVVKSSFVEA